MGQRILLTCEHADNQVPKEYDHLFQGKREILYNHPGYDLGALKLAKFVAAEVDLPLYYTPVTRLLVEANRSLNDKELFSEITKKQPENVKTDILNKYYHPYRKSVEEKIDRLLEGRNEVIHIALHTFAPVVDGEVRKTDIGLLFDPERQKEKEVAGLLRKNLVSLNPDLKVVFNEPYPGTDDCYPVYLRKKYSPDQYQGFEIEVNQRFFLTGEPDIWEKLIRQIASAINALVEKP